MAGPQQKFYLVTKRKEKSSAVIKSVKIAVVFFAVVGVVTIISRFFPARDATSSGASLPKLPNPAPAISPLQTPAAMPVDRQSHPADGTGGSLEISSNPPGLHYKVYAGQFSYAANSNTPAAKPVREGTTPARLEDVAKGIVTVVFSRPGWEDQIKEVNIGAVQANAGAEFRGGTVSVDSVPAGGEVLLDGVLAGITPLKIEAAPGPHKVSATYKAQSEQTRNVSVIAGQGSKVSIKFGTESHGQHAKPKPTPPESEWQKVQNSLKKLFSPDKKKPASHP